jgi:tetratricopeptide (TPR) repeat protein
MHSFLVAIVLLLSSTVVQAGIIETGVIDRVGPQVPFANFLELYISSDKRGLRLREITNLMLDGKRQEANAKIAKLLAKNPRDKDALELAGISLMQAQNFKVAEESFRRLVAMPPVKSSVLSKYGVTKILNGDLNGGVSLLSQVIQFEPDDLLAHRYLAVAAENLGDFANAVHHLEKLPPIGSFGLKEYHVALARNYMELKRYTDVVGLLGPAFADTKVVKPGMSASAALQLTLAQNAVGQMEKASYLEASLRETFADDPVGLFALDIGLARVRKDADSGRAAYEQFTRQTPEKRALVSAGYELALVYFAAQEHLAAIKELETVLGLAEDQHSTAEILRLLVPEFVAQSMISDAVAAMEQAITRYPGHQPFVYGLAELQIRTDINQAARRNIEKLLALDPPYTPAYLLGGQLARKEGDIELARRYLTVYTKAEPGRVDGWASLSGSYVDTGDTAGAIKSLEAGVAAVPDEPRLRFELASLHESVGDIEAANASYRAALEQDQDYLPVLDNLASNLLDMNKDIDEAYEYAKKAYAMSPEDPYIVDVWGWARYRKGELKEAKELLEVAVEGMRGSGRADYHLGLTLRDLGDKGSAAAHFKDALKKGMRDRQKIKVQEAHRQLQDGLNN